MEILLASLGSDRFKLRATDRNEWMRKHTWLFWSSLIVSELSTDPIVIGPDGLFMEIFSASDDICLCNLVSLV